MLRRSCSALSSAMRLSMRRLSSRGSGVSSGSVMTCGMRARRLAIGFVVWLSFFSVSNCVCVFMFFLSADATKRPEFEMRLGRGRQAEGCGGDAFVVYERGLSERKREERLKISGWMKLFVS